MMHGPIHIKLILLRWHDVRPFDEIYLQLFIVFVPCT